jgi:FixJ family two-component response regulator
VALVTDVDMPRLDGAGLARRLLRERPSLPIVFISGTAPEGVAVDSSDPSFPLATFVAKPFTDRVLLDALRGLLESD